ncbi:MAG: hypothetical protein HQK83_07665 [Fibrobacteria bacterium]|nr:hypothetical protein [Fibrobacteria bacterium]
MNNKISRSLYLSVSLLYTLLFISITLAEDNKKAVTFNGYLDADVAIDVNNEFKKPAWQSNQEVDLTSNIVFSEAVSVQLYTTFLTGNVPYGGAPAVNRWGNLIFDGIALSWTLNEITTLYVGDMVYNAGQLGYYAYKRPVAYGSVMSEKYIRGAGIDIQGLSLYMGSSDLANNQAGFYAAYDFSLNENLSFKPLADIRLGGVETDWHAALEFSLSGDFSLNATMGALAENGADANFTILIEPSYTMGKFSIAGTYYQAFNTDSTATPVSNIGEEMFAYIEPGLTINDLFAVGLPLEYHLFDESQIWVVPTAYFYPINDLEVWLWAGGVFPEEGDTGFSAGLELIAEF